MEGNGNSAGTGIFAYRVGCGDLQSGASLVRLISAYTIAYAPKSKKRVITGESIHGDHDDVQYTLGRRMRLWLNFLV